MANQLETKPPIVTHTLWRTFFGTYRKLTSVPQKDSMDLCIGPLSAQLKYIKPNMMGEGEMRYFPSLS
jgi:hypothetical protein